MKLSALATALAIGASVQNVAATGWHHAPPFPCPIKVPEICHPHQHNFDFHELIEGSFDHYGGLIFKGFTCHNAVSSFFKSHFEASWSKHFSASFNKGIDIEAGFSKHFGGHIGGGHGHKRDLAPRTFLPGKVITAEVSADFESSASFSVDHTAVQKMAILEFELSVEFDVDLEFHYKMPGGGICKHKQLCKKIGTIVKNTQCGGATDVTIIMPKPPFGRLKKWCKIAFHKIHFHCPKPGHSHTIPTLPSPTKPCKHNCEVPTTTPIPTVTPIPSSSTTDNGPIDTTSKTDEEPAPTCTPKPAEPICEEEAAAVPECAVTCIEPVAATFNCAADDYRCLCSNIQAIQSQVLSCVIGGCGGQLGAVLPAVEGLCGCVAAAPPAEDNEECPPATTDVPPPTSEEPTTPPPGTTTPPPKPPTTTIITTVVTEETVTTCDVTSTITSDGTTSLSTGTTISTVSVTNTKTITTCKEGCTKTTPPPIPTDDEPSPTDEPEPTDSTSDNSPIPTDTTPPPPDNEDCPAILPQCLNTWLPEECESNSDIDCFCPKQDFTKNVFDCLKSHGASKEEIKKAAKCLQGICAPHIPTNPGIIVDCPEDEEPVTTPPPTGPVTTITCITTITVPCEPEEGTITTSSSVTSISTTITVPDVTLTTQPGGDVEPVPGHPTPAPTVVPTGGEYPVEQPPYPTNTFVEVPTKSLPTGTGGIKPTGPIFTAGASAKSIPAAAGLVAFFALLI